jgi:peptidoglycan pentaglycine glycine transferase (the first glycine)
LLLTKVWADKYEKFNQTHPKGHFMQSLGWARVKSFWKNEIIIVEDDNQEIKGSLSVLIRKIPFLPCTIMYSPRGPVCDPHDETTLKELLDKAKQLAKKHKSYALKMDPDIEIEDTEFKEIVEKLGCKVSGGIKPYEGVQPRFVFRLYINNRSSEELLKSFHHKTRYNIRLAHRRGVECRVGTRDDLGDYHELMVETGIRDEFIIRPRSYYESVYDYLGSEHVKLFLAYYEGKPIAGSIAIVYGNKCWYLYGASSNEHRNVMPNYLLQWEMIKLAIESGCDIYDFRGVTGDLDENNPLYGLYRFKKGFNGKYTEFIGMVDCVFNPIMYFIVENGIDIFREARRRLYILKNSLKYRNKNE